MCAEENLLALPSDRHKDHRDIATHEFAHVIHRHGVDAAYGKRITAAYARAKADGLWRTAYAMTNEQEFFAELSMWYFYSRGDYRGWPLALHYRLSTLSHIHSENRYLFYRSISESVPIIFAIIY